MAYAIVKGNSNRKLNGISTGDLPIRNKLYYNEVTEKLEHKFALEKIFIYYPDCYTTFRTITEVQEHIDYIMKEIEANRTRYEEVLTGSTDKLLKYASNLKVIEE